MTAYDVFSHEHSVREKLGVRMAAIYACNSAVTQARIARRLTQIRAKPRQAPPAPGSPELRKTGLRDGFR